MINKDQHISEALTILDSHIILWEQLYIEIDR